MTKQLTQQYQHKLELGNITPSLISYLIWSFLHSFCPVLKRMGRLSRKLSSPEKHGCRSAGDLLEYSSVGRNKLGMLLVCQRHSSALSGSNSNSCSSNQRSEPHWWFEYFLCFSIWKTQADFGWIPPKLPEFHNPVPYHSLSVDLNKIHSTPVKNGSGSVLFFVAGQKLWFSCEKTVWMHPDHCCGLRNS